MLQLKKKKKEEVVLDGQRAIKSLMSRFSGMEGNLEMILAFFFLQMTRNMLLGRTDLFTWLVMTV